MRSRVKHSQRESLAELEALYLHLDALFAGSSCPASTECCRFGILGREPYVTTLELALVARAIARRGGPLAPLRRALPLIQSEPSSRGERTCALLDAGGRCSIYAARPFGCRSFFCDKANHERRVPHRETQALVRELGALATRYDPAGAIGRPLSRCLATLP